MATYSKVLLSGSTDGLPIAVVATATLGTTIHTAHATDKDEVWLYATNIDASAVDLTLEWGGTGAGENLKASIPPSQGLFFLIPGLVLTNSKVITAFASIASKINIVGWVNRITP